MSDTSASRDGSDVTSALAVRRLSVRLGGSQILHDVSLQVAAGSTLVVLGQSGCGKTTLLKAIAGLAPVEQGEVHLDGRDITTAAIRDRSIMYLDQEPLLFEHLNVFENVAFSMRMKGGSDSEIREAVSELLVATGLSDHALKRQHQLSGGQKQRVAFARAILARPRLLLLDEPFASLDSQTRCQMQDLFAVLRRHHQLTSIFVTHDVREALTVGQSFAAMTPEFQLFADRETFVQSRRPACWVSWHFGSLWQRRRRGRAKVDTKKGSDFRQNLSIRRCPTASRRSYTEGPVGLPPQVETSLPQESVA